MGNVNDSVTVVTDEVIQGAGQITVDGRVLGGFQGGVNMTHNQDQVYVDSEYIMGHIDAEKTAISMQVSTELEQATLENLAMAMGYNTSSVLSGTSSKILNLTSETTLQHLSVVFLGMSATNRLKNRTFTLVNAIRVGSTATKFQRGIKTVIPVTFECLVDSTASFGTIVDVTI